MPLTGRDFIRQRFESDVFMYDTSTGHWALQAPRGHPPCNRTGHAAIAHSDGVLFLGGLLDHGEEPLPTNSAILLDILSGTAAMGVAEPPARGPADRRGWPW